MKTWESVLREAAEGVGLFMATWSPGDGVTRYRFFSKPSGYFGPENGIYTALGKAEAMAYLRGAGAWIPAR